ncbi:MAG: hypothetical protein KIT57_08030 [Blastocatellales bacterium]|nr:hypothetical protein [Blastocatellales bacterium]
MKQSLSRLGARAAERFDDWFGDLAPSRLWHRLLHRRIDNLGLKLLAVLIGTMLFVISRQPMSDVRLVGVQIEYRGLASGLEISGDINQTVSVRLRGPRDVVRGLLPNQIAVVANLSNKDPGDRVIQLRTSDVSLPDSIEVLQIDPGTIRLRIEQTTRRRVRVDPELMGEIPDGYEIYRVSIDPPEVEIEGPQSHISQVNAVTTESVQLTGRTSSFDTAVDVDHPEHSVRVRTPGPLRLSIEIGERRRSRTLHDLRVKWLDPPAGARLLDQAVSIDVFGPRSAVEALRPEDIRVEIRTAGLPAGVYSVEPEVILPANTPLEIRRVAPQVIRFKR